ncbi:hypothetical protein Mgra_00009618 [Meloidogyne graminicola]|uniref:Uncharacterized protein n=1 Tax=Meloidogyne graminicola TaxID=189291 RepID=A0A8S9Z9J5_9BILA|nr:hypothetical protein Mgra_00009618 [Meloidogyne graminicola]
MNFNKPVPKGGIVLIAMGESDSMLMLDRNRTITTDISLNNNPEYIEQLKEFIGYNNTIPSTTTEDFYSSTPPTISERVQNSIGLAASSNPEKNITILDFWAMEHVNNVQFPSPCKEFPTSNTSLAQTIYCLSIIALWILLISFALTDLLGKFVNFRKTIKTKKEIELNEYRNNIQIV